MPLGKTIAFLGAGNMAEALVKGLLRAGVASPGEILLTDRRQERLAELEKSYGVRTSNDNKGAAAQAAIIVLSASSLFIT
jgi:pyrroline-5-carboxylate reductase